MAKATQTTTRRTTKVTIRSSGSGSKAIPNGMVECNVCKGKGYHKRPDRSNRRLPK